MINALLLAATLAQNAIAITNAAAQIDAAIVAKGGTTQGGLTNAAAAIAALPSGGGVDYTWKRDGKTHMWLTIPADMVATPMRIRINGNPSPITIEWGDGTSQTHVAGTVDHTYAAAGDYLLTMYSQTAGAMVKFYCDESRNVLGWNGNDISPCQQFVRQIEVAPNFWAGHYSLSNLPRCERMLVMSQFADDFTAATSQVGNLFTTDIETENCVMTNGLSGFYRTDLNLWMTRGGRVHGTGVQSVKAKTAKWVNDVDLPNSIIDYDTNGSYGQNFSQCTLLTNVNLSANGNLNPWMFHTSNNIRTIRFGEITNISPEGQTGGYNRAPFDSFNPASCDIYMMSNTYESVRNRGNGFPWGCTAKSTIRFHFSDCVVRSDGTIEQ